MTRAGTIPLSRISSIQIYHAKKIRERDMSKVLDATGGDFCFNGTIFSWSTYRPLCPTRSAGTVLCAKDWKSYGVSWNSPDDFGEAIVADSKSNYICCVPLITNGKKKDKPNYQKDMGGSRPRTAIGVKEGRFAYYVTSDGYTPERLRDLLYASGWSHATMLDGGGSTCFRDKSGSGFACDKSRVIPHYIVVTLRDSEPEGEKPMVEINAYSKAKDGGKKLSTNFKVSEFACKDGSDAILVAPRLVMVLQSIRSHFGAAVTIHSAYRTPQYNAKVGGVGESQHCYGTAADISVKGKTVAQVAAYARSIMPDWGGVGIYTDKGFTHVDVREAKADWNG
jgi:hypothetical protein